MLGQVSSDAAEKTERDGERDGRPRERDGVTTKGVQRSVAHLVVEPRAHQMPLAEKLAKADYVVDTSGTKEDTLRQTKLVFDELRRLAA